MAITTLPAVPQRTDDPTVYVTKADTFMAALPQFVTDANALAASLNSLAAGGAYAIPYTWGTQGTVGSGGSLIAFDQSTNSTTTTRVWVDAKSATGQTVLSILSSMATSGSATKGHIRIQKTTDATKYAMFAVTGYTVIGSSYATFNVTLVGASTEPIFALNDSVMMYFQRTGDVGSAGTLVRRLGSWVATTGTAQTVVPNVSNTDLLVVTANDNITLGVPTSTPSDGQGLMFRIKDNGTARTVAYNSIYRASAELPFPSTTTVGKNLYLGFIYNATDVKWDLIAAISAM